MDILHEAANRVVASGQVAQTSLQPGGFVSSLRSLTGSIGTLKSVYGKALANDGKVLGLERLDLIAATDRCIELVLAALCGGLLARYSQGLVPPVELSPTGEENHLRFRPASLSWQLRLQLPPQGGRTIADLLRDLIEARLGILLREVHRYAEDGYISTDEQTALLPALLSVADALLETRCYIESCASST